MNQQTEGSTGKKNKVKQMGDSGNPVKEAYHLLGRVVLLPPEGCILDSLSLEFHSIMWSNNYSHQHVAE